MVYRTLYDPRGKNLSRCASFSLLKSGLLHLFIAAWLLVMSGFAISADLTTNPVAASPQAASWNVSIQQETAPGAGSKLNLKAILPDNVTKVMIVFSANQLVSLTKAGKSWTGELALDSDYATISEGQLFVRVGQLRNYSGQFPFRVQAFSTANAVAATSNQVAMTSTQNQVPVVKTYEPFIYNIHFSKTDMQLAVFLDSDCDPVFTALFGAVEYQAMSQVRNQYYNVVDTAALEAEKKRKAEEDRKRKTYTGMILKPDYNETITHQLEGTMVSISGEGRNNSSMAWMSDTSTAATLNNLLNETLTGFGVNWNLDWRINGKTHLFDMQNMTVLKMGYKSAVQVGEENMAIEKMYSRFRGGPIVLQVGDLAPDFSPLSVGNNLKGFDMGLDLFWGLSAYALSGVGNRKWTDTPERASRFAQNISAFQLASDLGRMGTMRFTWAHGADDPASIAVPRDNPIDTTIMGADFDLRGIVDKNLNFSGEFYTGEVNLNTSSTNVAAVPQSAWSVTSRYTFDVHNFALTLSQIDPDFKSVGQDVSSGRVETKFSWRSTWLDRLLRLNAQVRSYSDEDATLGRKTTNLIPRLTAEYQPVKDMSDLKLFGFYQTRTSTTSDGSKDYSQLNPSAELRYKWGVFDSISLGYEMNKESDAAPSSNTVAKNRGILKGTIHAQMENFGPLSWSLGYTYRAEQDSVSTVNETVNDLQSTVVLDIFGFASIRANYAMKTISRQDGSQDIQASVGTPFTLNLNDKGTRRFEIEYKQDDYQYSDTRRNYTDTWYIGRLIWEL